MIFTVPLLLASCAAPVPPDLETLRTIEGSITWDVDFDSTAEAAGFVDCSYQRVDGGGAEDRSSPWRCRDCDVQFQVMTSLDEGLDCYHQIASDAPEFLEWLGTGPDGFYRTGSPNAPLAALGVAQPSTNGFDVAYVVDLELEDGGFTFDIRGAFTESTAQGDPLHGLTPPETYACGWPKADPPPYSGDYVLSLDTTIPDGAFVDSCGDALRLHDLAGQWWILDVSAADCGPCQEMARSEGELHDLLAGTDAHDTLVVTLLSASLASSDTASPALLDQWRSELDVDGPVLTDRGYGMAVVAEAIAALGGDFGYPALVLVDPELQVRSLGVGFGPSTWEELAAAIQQDAP